jgi:hypothetical protein
VGFSVDGVDGYGDVVDFDGEVDLTSGRGDAVVVWVD